MKHASLSGLPSQRVPFHHLYNSSTEVESCCTPPSLPLNAFFWGLTYSVAAKLVSVSMGHSMIGTVLWSAKPLTLLWTPDPIPELHHLFSKMYYMKDLLRCYMMGEGKGVTGAGKEQAHIMQGQPPFTQFALITHGDFTPDTFQGWNSS